MPAYEIHYLTDSGEVAYKFTADVESDGRAKVLAHAMKTPSAKRIEVWNGDALVYARPTQIMELRAG